MFSIPKKDWIIELLSQIHSSREKFRERRVVIKEFENPLTKNGGIRILRGNIAPNAAIRQPAATSHDIQAT